MYNAWLCYDKFSEDPTVKFVEPGRYSYDKVIPIVFSKVKDWKYKGLYIDE